MTVFCLLGMISTALRTETPLPQVTPCPLVDRFMIYTHGLNIIRQEEDDDYGLPRTMTIDTLENEQYLYVSRASCAYPELTITSRSQIFRGQWRRYDASCSLTSGRMSQHLVSSLQYVKNCYAEESIRSRRSKSLTILTTTGMACVLPTNFCLLLPITTSLSPASCSGRMHAWARSVYPGPRPRDQKDPKRS